MPLHVIMQGDFEPCDECKKNGITIIEAESDDAGEISVTGKSWLLKEEAFLRILTLTMLSSRPLFQKEFVSWTQQQLKGLV